MATNTQYTAGDATRDATYGDVTVIEAYEATDDSPEQYAVLTADGSIVRTTLAPREAAATFPGQMNTPFGPKTWEEMREAGAWDESGALKPEWQLPPEPASEPSSPPENTEGVEGETPA